MMRVLTVVRRVRSTTSPLTSTPRAARSAASVRPEASSPTRPTSRGAAPSEARLCATLAAPPRENVSRSTATTGTGASGEMRSTRPHR